MDTNSVVTDNGPIDTNIGPKEMTAVEANHLARQRRKIEKDRRRKEYDDIQVQSTNNSSIVSKRSVEMLYTKEIQPELGEWFKFFVPKSKRRSPAINRGYWIRMEAIRQMVLRIADANQGRKINVINLGCGFDPLPFQLLSMRTGAKFNFLDFDYPDLIKNKLKMIQEAPEVLELIGPRSNNNATGLGIVLSTETYQLVGCDLKDGQLYKKQLDYLLDHDSVNIFIAEVSLAYMKPEYANPIIAHSSSVRNSHFVILEQILPDTKHNAFAEKMLYHFNHLRSPLQCVETYPRRQDQISRFQQYFPTVELRDLFENWNELVDAKTREKIARVEAFDEWEEFIIFCQHYVIVHATNTDTTVYSGTGESEETIEVDTSVVFEYVRNDIQLKFPGVAAVGEKVYVQGGLERTRRHETLEISGAGPVRHIDGEDGPPARMCHSMDAIGNDLVVIGGRTKPESLLQDTYMFKNHKWTRLDDLAAPRSRHATARVGDEILVFGGLESQGSDSHHSHDSLFVMVSPAGVRKMQVRGDTIGNLIGSCMSFNGNYGVIVGGMSDPDQPSVSRAIYRFSVAGDIVTVTKVISHWLFERIGAKCLLDKDKLVVVGGVSPSGILDRGHQVISLDLTTHKIQQVEIPLEVYHTHPPLLIGFGLAGPTTPSSKHYYVVGGGGVCYSFGTRYNSVYRISLK